jgi:hypothetical protein
MSKDQFLLVLRFYRNALSGVPQEADHGADLAHDEQLEHLLFMLNRMETMYEEDPEKAMRWLGFVQGVLWSQGDYTIDELRIQNTNPDLLKFEGLC